MDDQVGQPTWTVDVADRRPRAGPGRRARRDLPRHLVRRQCSWFDFAQRVVVAAGLESSTVLPTTSDAFVRPAPRPAYSVLGHDALTGSGLEPIGDWESRWAEAATSVLA